MRKYQFQWRLGANGLPHKIDAPDETRRIDSILRQALVWTEASFCALWKPQLQEFPYIFDHDRRAEVLRDAFLLVSDLLEVGKTRLAFSSLNEILDTIPRYFINSHPGLFLCILEAALGLNMPKAPKSLHKKVKEHLAEISWVLHGPSHPLTVLLSQRSEDCGNVFYIMEVLLSCMRDSLAKVFGHSGYQTRFYEFTMAQNYARMGKIEEAQLTLIRLIRVCSDQFGSDSGFVGLSEFELNRIRLDWPASQSSANQGETPDNNHMLFKVEKAFQYYNQLLATQIKQESPTATLEIPCWRIELARYLFHKRRYTIAMHLYCSGSFEELSICNPQVKKSPDTWLADRIANAAKKAFQIESTWAQETCPVLGPLG
ncbi:hypothetical protein LTR84_003927 [Exophiala bonariae]|uniref:Uncharacterized protein n=1 Tax=Exophiala bonariae TaxID=1690606 RepID=A0AAV9NA78_9EURO|nr:hypothetical protein LTR84_003927 [Exophiala bonariae]